MLKCSTSLWSADLGNLTAEVHRVNEYSERFHLDVADGHYTPTMLFFPDLVAALRPHTMLPFEVHLMCTRPLDWIESFSEAGADSFIFCYDSLDDVNVAIDQVKKANKEVGISLSLDDPLDVLEPYWSQLDLVCLIGTPVGTKGTEMNDDAFDRIAAVRRIIDERGLNCLIQADGGIRRHTVPSIYSAGADYIVPGSLMFKEDPLEMRKWLASLEK